MSFGQNELIGDGNIWVHGIATDAEGSSARGRDAILFISPTQINSFLFAGMTDYASAMGPKAILKTERETLQTIMIGIHHDEKNRTIVEGTDKA